MKLMQFALKKSISLLLVFGVLSQLLVSVAFAEAARPSGISLMSDRVTPGFRMEFYLYDELNRRQNVNRGDVVTLPEGYFVDLEYNANYPTGNWEFRKVLMQNSFDPNSLQNLPYDRYGFTVPDEEGYYRLTVRDENVDAVLTEVFEVSREPFIVVDRIVAPGAEVLLRIYNENGGLWDIDRWGNQAGEYALDVFSIGSSGFNAHAGLGLSTASTYQIEDHNDGTYSYPAGNVVGDFYVDLKSGSGSSFADIDSTSYDVFGVAVEREEPEEEEEEEEVELPPVQTPEDYEEEEIEDVCDPGEICDEDEEEDEEIVTTALVRADLLAEVRLPKFAFVKKVDDQNEDYDCSDLSGHWSENLIRDLLRENLYPVDSDSGECRPAAQMKREALMAWLLVVFYDQLAEEALELDFESAYNPYVDLDADFGPYVLKATEAGIVHGQGGCAAADLRINCKFGNGVVVNRAEILKMAIESAGLEIDLEALKENYPEKDPVKMFEDIDDDQDWFYSYLYFATANEVIQGFQLGGGKYAAGMNQGLTFDQSAKIITLIDALR